MLSLIPVSIMHRLLPAFLVVCLTAAGPVWAAADAPVRVGADAGLACDMPTELTTPTALLPQVTAAIASKKSVNILALGSGSTVGDGGGAGGPALAYRAPEASFPFRMTEALGKMRPGLKFQLTVQGGRGMTADAMLPLLKKEIQAHHYDLVLWQTGTVEAVHGQRPDSLRAVLQDGAEAVAAAKGDLVLIDPQFSRFLRANTDVGPYQTVMQQVAMVNGITLFHRFELTQGWVNNDQVDLERVNRDKRDETIALLNNCLGQALARYVLTGAGEH
jgi:acyl-CoA thioesterase-1